MEGVTCIRSPVSGIYDREGYIGEWKFSVQDERIYIEWTGKGS
jgi:hypothetical protein